MPMLTLARARWPVGRMLFGAVVAGFFVYVFWPLALEYAKKHWLETPPGQGLTPSTGLHAAAPAPDEPAAPPPTPPANSGGVPPPSSPAEPVGPRQPVPPAPDG